MQASILLKPLRTNKRFLYLALLTFFLSSCYRVPDKIEPRISYAVQDRYLKSLPAAFSPLTNREKDQAWGQEYLIGLGFAKELDLYRAITAFLRSEILIPRNETERKLELSYNIMLCYYLAQKYSDVLETFNKSKLVSVDQNFTAYHDLLIILYESYKETGDTEKSHYVFQIIEKEYPEEAKKLELSTALQKGNIACLKGLAKEEPDDLVIADFLKTYELESKSVTKAQRLNMIPGAGYLYVGQKQSAITAFLFNGLFIAAAVYFFKDGNIPAGIVTTSFEMGWYFGGIYGAGEAAKLYNERIYEANAYIMMNKKQLSPALMINYAF